MNSIIGNNQPPSKIDRSLVDKLNEEAKREEGLRRKRAEQEALQKGRAEQDVQTPQATVEDPEYYPLHNKYLFIKDISCVGSDGKVFERYDRLEIGHKVVQDEDYIPDRFTPYKAITYLEESFVPSFALHCNILATLYKEREKSTHIAEMLDHYNRWRCWSNTGSAFWHPKYATNTLISDGEIVHYPRDTDFQKSDRELNAERPLIRRRFDIEAMGEPQRFEYALQNPACVTFLQDLTGLREPRILAEIGVYLRTDLLFEPPLKDEKTATWFGSAIPGEKRVLTLSARGSLQGKDYVVRGVCIPEVKP